MACFVSNGFGSQQNIISYGFVLSSPYYNSATMQIVTATNYTCKVVSVTSINSINSPGPSYQCVVYSQSGYWYAYLPTTGWNGRFTQCGINCEYFGSGSFDPSFFANITTSTASTTLSPNILLMIMFSSIFVYFYTFF
jgi:hypothetical protein